MTNVSLFSELLKRLDDEKDEVRVSSALALSRLWSNLSTPSNYSSSTAVYRVHLDFVTDVLLLHLDDDNENVAGAVGEALKSLGGFDASFLIEKCHRFKDKHRSPDYCQELVEYFEGLEIEK